jgi:Putative auto-transporter adhesin, head GIN domain
MPVRAPRRAVLRHAIVVVASAALASAVLAGCGAMPPGGSPTAAIVGEGEVQSETRELPPFSRISVAAGMRVIAGEEATQSVSLSAQANILPVIKTEVVDGQLIVTIDVEGGISTTEPISLAIKVPEIESVALSAGSVGYVEHTGGRLLLDVSAGAQLTAIGDTPDLTLTASTGSHAKLAELVAQNAGITVNDGSTAELNVTGTLSGTADGGSTVVLATKPSTVTVKTSSGATIQGG